MDEYEPWLTKPEDENVAVEIKSATFGWNEVYLHIAKCFSIPLLVLCNPEGQHIDDNLTSK